MKPKLIATGIGLCFCLYGCFPDRRYADTDTYVPVYMSPADKSNIFLANARTTEKSGKIYAFGNTIFQNDLNKGIHIIDNTNHADPKKIAFLNIPYNTEFAVKGNYIYANNVNDLVVIDIRDLNNPVVVKRIENAFPYINQEYPPQSGYFVCPDPAKGIVVDWELQTVKSPKCHR
ncbi:hypothetical protein A3860_24700 [Niastella vici]|uniref:LVIVD repeat-containing protein n=1 Tax=Niastella vici TaxID=1703345 RepID=A0A1V9FYW7_9BACT|nr:hypothetical protein [Niastella vici]OQP63543.1 hypothetical protein A3860_24700 [Niastella vici]